MKLFCPQLLALMVLAFGFNAVQANNPQNVSENGVNYYKQGIAAKEDGRFREALEIWEKARMNHQVDSRIGFAYIETATEEQIRDFYEQASTMYFWALETDNLRRNKESIQKELQRLKPVLGIKRFNRLNHFLKKRNPKVLEGIKNFWVKNDPTIDSEYNERLIEHWERIAYAREHFTENTSTVYGTDDRTLIYLKYGEPQYVREGTLTFEYSEVKSWARELTRIKSSRGSNLFSNSAGNPANSSAQGSDFGNSMAMQTESIAEQVTQKIRQYFMNPRYSIWVYRGINEDQYSNVIYIFGESGDGGQFGLRRSVEDFIPRRAFRPVNRIGSTGITPAIMLQLMIYDKLSIADPFFGDAYRNLESSIFNLNESVSSQLAFQQKTESEFKLADRRESAPTSVSTYLETVPQIDIRFRQYRMLDEGNDPYLLTLFSTNPQEAFLTSSAFDLSEQKNIDIENYSLSYVARVLNEQWESVAEKKSTPDFREKVYEIDGNRYTSGIDALFQLPHVSNTTDQSFSVTLRDKNQDQDIAPNAFPHNLKGIGNKTKTQPELLSTDPAELEMGDIILGCKAEDRESNRWGIIPFSFNTEHVIPSGQNLMVHFEVYHLDLNPDGVGKFQLEYQIRKVKTGNIVTRLLGTGDDGEVSLTLNFETIERFFRDNIEIKTTVLEDGEYILDMSVTDLNSGQRVNRETEFVVAPR